jgi:hypothetical protein
MRKLLLLLAMAVLGLFAYLVGKISGGYHNGMPDIDDT